MYRNHNHECNEFVNRLIYNLSHREDPDPKRKEIDPEQIHRYNAFPKFTQDDIEKGSLKIFDESLTKMHPEDYEWLKQEYNRLKQLPSLSLVTCSYDDFYTDDITGNYYYRIYLSKAKYKKYLSKRLSLFNKFRFS